VPDSSARPPRSPWDPPPRGGRSRRPPRRRGNRAPAIALLAAAVVVVAAVIAMASGGGGGSASHHAAHAANHRHRAAAHRPVPPAHPALVPPASPAPRTVRVPILMYHRVHAYATELTKSLPDLTVEPPAFAAELTALQRAGYRSITVAQLFGALFRGAPLPPKPVLISADDGYLDDLTQILPVLRAHRMTAVFFIITGRFHEPGFLTASQVRRLDQAGMDIGAHTRDHVDLPGIGAAQLANEVAGSRQDLQRLLGHPVAAFAYPAGRFDDASVAAVRQAGFALAVTTQPGEQESARQPLLMPRVRVGRSMTPQGLLSCLASGGGC
jgi:peptidoglycan/xylan/chitin deacetylase (PgdA/CDA1 family)